MSMSKQTARCWLNELAEDYEFTLPAQMFDELVEALSQGYTPQSKAGTQGREDD